MDFNGVLFNASGEKKKLTQAEGEFIAVFSSCTLTDTHKSLFCAPLLCSITRHIHQLPSRTVP